MMENGKYKMANGDAAEAAMENGKWKRANGKEEALG